VRKVQRRIGDNALCIRKWPAMEGRIYSMEFAPDGKSFAATSSLDGTGAVNFYNYDFNTEMPAEILAIEDKAGRTEAEKKKEDDYFTSNVKLLGSAPFNAGIYALSYEPDGKTVAAAGEDGKVRLISAANAKVTKEFVPVPIGANSLATQTAQLESK
jgi:WD40 repeat protein